MKKKCPDRSKNTWEESKCVEGEGSGLFCHYYSLQLLPCHHAASNISYFIQALFGRVENEQKENGRKEKHGKRDTFSFVWRKNREKLKRKQKESVSLCVFSFPPFSFPSFFPLPQTKGKQGAGKESVQTKEGSLWP